MVLFVAIVDGTKLNYASKPLPPFTISVYLRGEKGEKGRKHPTCTNRFSNGYSPLHILAFSFQGLIYA